LCLVALEQYVDVNPWDDLRFGALNPPASGDFRGAKWRGHVYEIAVAPALTKLVRDGVVRFQADRGVVVRDYTIGPSAVSFTIHTGKVVRVTTEEFASGSLRLGMDGMATTQIAVQNGQASFSVPAGEHEIRLEKR
jgi:hypothetical protein